MIKSIRIWILVFSVFFSIKTLYSQQSNVLKTGLDEKSKFIAFDFGGGIEGGAFLLRMDGSFNKTIHTNGFLGFKIGFEANGTYYNKIQIGPCYNYLLFNTSFTPFIAIDLRGERTTQKSYIGSTNNYNFSYYGATGLIGLGCKYKISNKRIGLTCKYSIGSSFYRPLNITYSLNNYKLKLVNYIQIGLTYDI